MGKDIAETIKRADRFKVILIGEGILVGFFAGFVVLLYRVALEFAGEWMKAIVGFASQNALSMAVWFAAKACEVTGVTRVTTSRHRNGNLLSREGKMAASRFPMREP